MLGRDEEGWGRKDVRWSKQPSSVLVTVVFLAQEPQTSDWLGKRICISFEVAGPRKKRKEKRHRNE